MDISWKLLWILPWNWLYLGIYLELVISIHEWYLGIDYILEFILELWFVSVCNMSYSGIRMIICDDSWSLVEYRIIMELWKFWLYCDLVVWKLCCEVTLDLVDKFEDYNWAICVNTWNLMCEVKLGCACQSRETKHKMRWKNEFDFSTGPTKVG